MKGAGGQTSVQPRTMQNITWIQAVILSLIIGLKERFTHQQIRDRTSYFSLVTFYLISAIHVGFRFGVDPKVIDPNGRTLHPTYKIRDRTTRSEIALRIDI